MCPERGSPGRFARRYSRSTDFFADNVDYANLGIAATRKDSAVVPSRGRGVRSASATRACGRGQASTVTRRLDTKVLTGCSWLCPLSSATEVPRQLRVSGLLSSVWLRMRLGSGNGERIRIRASGVSTQQSAGRSHHRPKADLMLSSVMKVKMANLPNLPNFPIIVAIANIAGAGRDRLFTDCELDSFSQRVPSRHPLRRQPI